MKPKIPLFIIALIALSFLLVPSDAITVPGTSTTYVRSAQPNNNFVNLGTVNANSSAGVGVQWVLVDLGNSYSSISLNISVQSVFKPWTHNIYTVGAFDPATVTWNTKPTLGTLLFTGLNISNVQTYNANITGTNIRYIAMLANPQYSDNIQTNQIFADGFSFNVLPIITTWSNSFTNSASLNISPPIGTNVIFSITGTSQNVTTYTWAVDGGNQNNNFSSFSTAFTATSHTVSATITNANGTSFPVTWNINGGFPTPPNAGSNGAGISWDRDTYVTGQIGNVTGNITISPPLFGFFRIDITNSSGSVLSSFVWDSSLLFPQIENFLFSFPTQDVYTATLFSHSPIFGDENLANATAQVIDPKSYIFAPSTATTGTNITITYQYNPAPGTGAIEDVITDNFGFNGLGTYINTSLCPCDTGSHTIQYVINGAGTHTLRLWDTTNFTIVATTIVKVNDIGAVVPGNITSNFLALDNTQYSIGDVIQAQYQISSSNWSSHQYFKGALVSAGGLGMGFVTLGSQVGQFQIPVSAGQFNIIQAGSAFVNITGGNSVIDTNAVLMASVPVTILANHNGYSVSPIPSTDVCQDQKISVKYTGPTGTGILQTEYLSPAGTTKFVNDTFTQNGTKIVSFTTGTIKDQSGILFNILDTSGNFQVNDIIKYHATGCTVPGSGTPGATAGATATQSGSELATGLAGLLNMNLFWALLMTAAFMIAIAVALRKGEE